MTCRPSLKLICDYNIFSVGEGRGGVSRHDSAGAVRAVGRVAAEGRDPPSQPLVGRRRQPPAGRAPRPTFYGTL